VGAWLIASPWVLGYSGELTPMLNTVFPGAVLVAAELANVEGHERAEEWVDVFVGLWLVVSPFLFGFDSSKPAAVNSVAAGALTILFAGWALSPLDDKIRSWCRERPIRH
jgi:hypothetical protein